MNWRGDLFLKEIKEAKIKPNDKVLHVGCGMIPTTSILIADKTKARIVGIDNNGNAVRYANKIIANKGLSNLIKIEYCEGQNYPVYDFDVILIAANVFPINDVLKHISKHMKEDARIICRGRRNDIKYCLDRSGLSNLFTIKEVSQNSRSQSFLLKKAK
jgi:cyclopropane fatty-acyl-phospholipid synthase-like methyltransferase